MIVESILVSRGSQKRHAMRFILERAIFKSLIGRDGCAALRTPSQSRKLNPGTDTQFRAPRSWCYPMALMSIVTVDGVTRRIWQKSVVSFLGGLRRFVSNHLRCHSLG